MAELRRHTDRPDPADKTATHTDQTSPNDQTDQGGQGSRADRSDRSPGPGRADQPAPATEADGPQLTREQARAVLPADPRMWSPGKPEHIVAIRVLDYYEAVSNENISDTQTRTEPHDPDRPDLQEAQPEPSAETDPDGPAPRDREQAHSEHDHAPEPAPEAPPADHPAERHPDTNRKLGEPLGHSDDRDTSPEAARITQLETLLKEREAEHQAELDERDSKLDAANAEIAQLRQKSEEQGAMLGDVLDRVNRLEQAGPDTETGATDGHEQPERRQAEVSERRDVERPGSVRDRERGGDEQLGLRENSRWTRLTPSDAAIGAMWTTFNSAMTAAALGRPSLAATITVVGSVGSPIVACLAWVRQRRKVKNADRPED